MRGNLPALGLVTAIVLAATSAIAQTSTSPAPGTQAANNPAKPSKADQHFLSEAIQGDLSEVNMGKLAQDKGQSDGVKQFGKMLEQDHGSHLKKAQQMAQQMSVNAPAEPTAKSKAMHDKLSAMSGAKFDAQFAKAMVKDHKHDIAAYKKEAKRKGPLGDFAAATVPTLEKHLKTAESLAQMKQSHR